jgi:hypothetical protein
MTNFLECSDKQGLPDTILTLLGWIINAAIDRLYTTVCITGAYYV